MKGFEYHESKNDEQEEQIKSKHNNQIEIESYQDEDEFSFSVLENLLDNCKYRYQNMDENIQEENEDIITEQSNEDKDNDNSDNEEEENKNINELMKRDKWIRGQTSKGRIIKTPSRYMHLHTKYSKNTKVYETKHAQLMALKM